MQQEEDSSRLAPQFSMDEVESFKAFARKPEPQQRIFDLIAPQIYGSDQIKKALACLLFGGARKVRCWSLQFSVVFCACLPHIVVLEVISTMSSPGHSSAPLASLHHKCMAAITRSRHCHDCHLTAHEGCGRSC